MIIHHRSVGGKCIYCGLRTSTFHSSPEGEEPEFRVDGAGNVLFSDPMYFECPGARALFLKIYACLFLPLVFLTGSWVPLSFALSLGVLVFGVWLSPAKQRWLGMSEVREEYESLVRVLPRGRNSFYLKKIDEALRPLFGFRDKALKAVRSIASTPPEEIENQIDIIRTKCQTLDDPDLTVMYRNQIRDLYQNLARIQEMQLFLEKFEASKKCVISSIQLLRNKMVVAEQNSQDVNQSLILDDLKMLHDIYARVNEPSPKPAKVPSPAGGPASPQPGECFPAPPAHAPVDDEPEPDKPRPRLSDHEPPG